MSELRPATIDPANPPTVFTMGLGTVVTASVVHEGLPGLYFSAADRPGSVGDDAWAEVEKGVPSKAVILRFASLEAVEAHLEWITRMVEAYGRDRAAQAKDQPA